MSCAGHIIAVGEGYEFWRIGDEVYRSKVGSVKDIYGLPQDKRWECSYNAWLQYRAVFSWAKDIEVIE